MIAGVIRQDSNLTEKIMAKSTLLITLISLAFASVANAQSELYLLEAPVNGALRPIAGNTAVMYVGSLGANDSFAFATEDANGVSFIDVTLATKLGAMLISSTDFGGPLALCAASFAMTKPEGGGATPATPATPPVNAGEENANGEQKARPYVVIIYVDQPGKGGDRNVHEFLDAGHTFMEVINGETGESTTVGLYPKNGVGLFCQSDDGDIRNDSETPWDVKARIEITEKQYKELIEQIEYDRKVPPKYYLRELNCTDWVLNILYDVGIKIKSEENDFPFPISGKGHNPGNLGEDLVKYYGGVRNRTSSVDQQSGMLLHRITFP